MLNGIFSVWKDSGPGQLRTRDFCRPRRIRLVTYRLNMSRTLGKSISLCTKIPNTATEFCDFVEQIVNSTKRLCPKFITFANRKSNKATKFEVFATQKTSNLN